MKFYDRERETESLREMAQLAESDYSKMTVVVGRRRIGKTLLINHALNDGRNYVYLFVANMSEGLLCQRFCSEISEQLGVFVPTMTKFDDFFRFVFQIPRSFSLVIDEFQNLGEINQSVFSIIQDYWDRFARMGHINFVVSGSIFRMMHDIFENSARPLFGRANRTIHLRPFSTDVLKQILSDHNPNYTNDDLLALYTFTGGIAKYVEDLMDAKATTVHRMILAITRSDAPYLQEGRTLLSQQFGNNSGTYYSILQAIANGRNTQGQIEDYLGGQIVGGQLRKLEESFDIIKRHRPIFAKPNSQTVRYEIHDVFLKTWFHYIDSNQSLIENRNFKKLTEHVSSDYNDFSGRMLEHYFRQKMMEEQKYQMIGSWWDGKGEDCEIDIVALVDKSKAVAIEVKRQKKHFDEHKFFNKLQLLRTKSMPHYDITYSCFDMTDM